MAKQQFTKGLAKTLLCSAVALAASTSVDAQVVVYANTFPPPPIHQSAYFGVSRVRGHKNIGDIGDIYTFPLFKGNYAHSPGIDISFHVGYYEKVSEKDIIDASGDTVWVTDEKSETIPPVAQCKPSIFARYLFKRLCETPDILSEEYDGGITLYFTIKKDGSISNVTSETRVRYVSQEFIDAVTKAILETPNWKPAIKGNENVESVCCVGINVKCRHQVSDNLAKKVQGTYKLTKIGREDGSVIDSPFDQYIISTNGYHLELTSTPPSHHGDIANINIRRKTHDVDISETEPAAESAKEEWLANPPVPKVYDINKKGFTMKWFNNFKQYGGGPYNSWITETWERNKPSKTFKAIMETLKAKAKEDNPMLGIWRCNGSNFYKIYGEDYSIVLWNNAGKWTLKKFSGTMNGNLRNVEYIHENLTMEAGSPCMIEWIDANNFRLHYRSAEQDAEQDDTWTGRQNKLKLKAEEWERVDADSNDDVYEIVNDIINCK